jgi:hypothetical protein
MLSNTNTNNNTVDPDQAVVMDEILGYAHAFRQAQVNNGDLTVYMAVLSLFKKKKNSTDGHFCFLFFFLLILRTKTLFLRPI